MGGERNNAPYMLDYQSKCPKYFRISKILISLLINGLRLMVTYEEGLQNFRRSLLTNANTPKQILFFTLKTLWLGLQRLDPTFYPKKITFTIGSTLCQHPSGNRLPIRENYNPNRFIWLQRRYMNLQVQANTSSDFYLRTE